MNVVERVKQKEYSSLVIGSKQLPKTVIMTRRQHIPLSTKVFHRKNDVQSYKGARMHHRMRTRNERPDIFLEGEHVFKIPNMRFNHFDLKQFEISQQRSKMTHKLQIDLVRKQVIECDYRTTGCTTSNVDFLKTSQGEIGRRTSLKALGRDKFMKSQKIHLNNPKLIELLRNETQLSQPKYHKKGQHDKTRKQSAKILDIRPQTHMRRRQQLYMKQSDLGKIKAQSFIVKDYGTGQTIVSNYSRKVLQIASLTKIMTCFVVLKLVKTYNVNIDMERVQIDSHVSETTGTSAELYEGDIYTIRQLLYAMMLPSGNDAAIALAKWAGRLLRTDREVDAFKLFVNCMNRTAIAINMKSSTFTNPHGLPNHLNCSTAQDLSTLIGHCLQIPLFCQVVRTKTYRCVTQNHGTRRDVIWQNTNKLLKRPGFQGIKTGVTTTAGPCLATLYKTIDQTMIIVLLRTNKLSRRFKQTRYILSWVLSRINYDKHREEIIRLQQHDAEMDSDNSEEENQFNFERNDNEEMSRRMRILQNEL